MGIMSVVYNQSLNLLKKGLQASNLRAKTIANNMANINTKNFKKSTVVFEENFKENPFSLELKRINERHLGSRNSAGDISVVKNENTSMRTDGNNVDIDIEKVNQAANTLKYNAMITRISGKYNELKAIMK